MRNPITRYILSAGALLVVWLLFAPIQLGGQTTFIIVNGNSMEPLYQRGDLVIIRAAPDYTIGEIVTYQHPQIGPVIHRIIGREGERWIFQGDHNDFIDPYRPLSGELLGRAWLHIPRVGQALLLLRQSPLLAGLLLGGGVIVMFIIPTTERKNRRGQPKRLPEASTGGWRSWALALLATLALASLALAGAAFSRPLSQEISTTLSYTHQGRFSYSADAPRGLYDSADAQTGDPIFREISRELHFDFSYQFASDEPADLSGSYDLTAVLSAQNGWKRTLTLLPPQLLHGAQFSAQGSIALNQLNTLITQFEAQTGLQRQQYTLTLIPHIAVAGSIAGQPLHDSFAPGLEFQLDSHQLQLIRGPAGDNVLLPTQGGSLTRNSLTPNSLAIFGLQLDVAATRQGGLIGAAIALGLGVMLGLPLLYAARRSEAIRVAMRYGPLIIDTAGPLDLQAGRLVRLSSIDDLARLAERHGALMMRDRSAGNLRYAVKEGDVTYLYAELAPPASTSQVEAPPAPAAAATAEPAAAAGPSEPWQERFLQALRESGMAADACRSIGIDMVTAYRERERSAAFAEAWKEARLMAWQHHTLKGQSR